MPKKKTSPPKPRRNTADVKRRAPLKPQDLAKLRKIAGVRPAQPSWERLRTTIRVPDAPFSDAAVKSVKRPNRPHSARAAEHGR
jgi:hypothetical protein